MPRSADTRGAPLQITELRTYKFSVVTGPEVRDPTTGQLISSTHKAWLFLKIETDSGIDGWGDGTGEWLVDTVEVQLHAWRELLIGADPLVVTALTDDLADRVPWKGGAVFGTASAAVNMALYDIAGKAWGGTGAHYPGRLPPGTGAHLFQRCII